MSRNEGTLRPPRCILIRNSSSVKKKNRQDNSIQKSVFTLLLQEGKALFYAKIFIIFSILYRRFIDNFSRIFSYVWKKNHSLTNEWISITNLARVMACRPVSPTPHSWRQTNYLKLLREKLTQRKWTYACSRRKLYASRNRILYRNRIPRTFDLIKLSTAPILILLYVRRDTLYANVCMYM